MMDYHLMYNDLMDKTNAIFADAGNIRSRIHKMIGYSPLQFAHLPIDILSKHLHVGGYDCLWPNAR